MQVRLGPTQWKFFRLLNYLGNCEPVCDLRNLNLAFLADLSTANKDHEALNSRYTIALSTYLSYLHIIFLALFNRFWSETAETSTFARALHLPLVVARGSNLHINPLRLLTLIILETH